MQKLTIGLCVEPGNLEIQAAMLVASLRACGGVCANVEVAIVSPRGKTLSARANAFFRELNCQIIVEDINKNFKDYPMANKPYSASWLATQTKSLWFLDSDTLIADDLEPLRIHLQTEATAILRPVWPGGFHDFRSMILTSKKRDMEVYLMAVICLLKH